jgi:MinD superfamily P-loop ATPase
MMNLAIASGKGGTGKTTVAVNLADAARRAGRRTAYLDCDVEEPNGHLFLKPRIDRSVPVGLPVPRVDSSVCTLCGQCADLCQYGAITVVGDGVLVFPEMCHGCGGCIRVCRPGAITEVQHPMGTVETGDAGGIGFVHGMLSIGQAMSPPVIRAVKAAAPESEVVILDAPPGTSCPVVATVRGADYVLLVTEATPFGLNDLKLAVDMLRALDIPFGVVINRAGLGDRATHRYCREQGIELLAEIPDDRRVAEAYSRGEMVADALPEFRPLFDGLLCKVLARGERQP